MANDAAKSNAPEIVLASGNAGKLRELSKLFAKYEFTVRPQSDFWVNDAEETGLTFAENALIKARNAAFETGLPAIADDSGLVVDALDGAPSIRSARYAGKHGDDDANNRLLLAEMRDVPEAERTARFVCVLAFLRHAEDPLPAICAGVWEGRILTKPQGEDGFGYDPLFWVPERECSAAELTPAVKNRLSHRGKALKLLAKQLNT